MKILHVNEFFYPFVAGPSKRILDMAQHIGRLECHIAVSFDKTENLQETDEYEGLAVRRFGRLVYEEFHRLVHLKATPCGALDGFREYVRALRPTCLSIYWVEAIPDVIANAVPEMRVVYTPYSYRKNGCGGLLGSKRAKIVLFSEADRQSYREAGVPEERLFMAEKPIDVNVFCPMSVKRDPYRLLYVGRIHPYKQLSELLYAMGPLFKDYPRLSFHIVGDLHPEKATEDAQSEIKKIQEAVDELGIVGRVRLRGKCLGEDLIREFSEASIHLLASVSPFEYRNTATQEALTMGLECIHMGKGLSDWPEYREDGRKLEHYVTGLDDFEGAIRHLLEEQHQSHRDYAIRNWSWDRWKPVYETIYREW